MAFAETVFGESETICGTGIVVGQLLKPPMTEQVQADNMQLNTRIKAIRKRFEAETRQVLILPAYRERLILLAGRGTQFSKYVPYP